MAVTLSNSPIREVLVGVSTNITENQLKQFENRAKIEDMPEIKYPARRFGL